VAKERSIFIWKATPHRNEQRGYLYYGITHRKPKFENTDKQG